MSEFGGKAEDIYSGWVFRILNPFRKSTLVLERRLAAVFRT
jgi:hypothetical protein